MTRLPSLSIASRSSLSRVSSETVELLLNDQELLAKASGWFASHSGVAPLGKTKLEKPFLSV